MDTISTASPASSSDDGSTVPGPIVHVRADSDSTMEALFDIALKPSGMQRPLQIPLRMRNLPASFWQPPPSGSKSPSCHSRENSLDNGLNDRCGPYSPMQQCSSPQPVGSPSHNRAHSSPASLQQTLTAAGSVSQSSNTQQQFILMHMRQGSYDPVSGSDSFGPLPPGWEIAKTPQGQLYFMNHITKTTQWEDPRKQIQQQMLQQLNALNSSNCGSTTPHRSVGSLSPQPIQRGAANTLDTLGALPSGWEQGVTPEGDPYFINHATKKTTWFDPRIPIHNQRVPVRQLPDGCAVSNNSANVQLRRQQEMRLLRLENERRAIQQRQAELKKSNIKQERLRHSDSNVQAAQEMLMRQNLNDQHSISPVATTSPAHPFHAAASAVAAAQSELHNRQESADSGLGMGSTLALGSIPETMETDIADSSPATNNGGSCAMDETVSNMDSDQLISSLPNNITDELGELLDNEGLMTEALNATGNASNGVKGLLWL